MVKLKVSHKGLEEVVVLKEELAWELDFLLPAWAYTAGERLEVLARIKELRKRLQELSAV